MIFTNDIDALGSPVGGIEQLESLISDFFKDQENTYLFFLIRKELKKLIEIDSDIFDDVIFSRFGVTKKIKRINKEIVFIDHSFHCKTASSMFFLLELEKYYDVDIIWSKSWKGLPERFLSSLESYYSNAIYWQVLPDLKNRHPKNTIMIPMWDAIKEKHNDFYESYKMFPFLCFSKAMYQRCIHNSIPARYLKVMPEVRSGDLINSASYNLEFTPPSIYFWQRNSDFTWLDLKKVISNNPISRVVLCRETDPNASFVEPSCEDITNYNIEIISWSDNKSAVLDLLKEIDIYVAPRMAEGIGFSFIEAIECGCTIICNNESTMNEYVDESIGYLINYNNPEPLDLSKWKEKKINMSNLYLSEKQKCDLFSERLFNIMEEIFI